eukprot:9445853-Pyramimonas_sp.AAC.1
MPEWEDCNIPVCSTCDMFERGGKTDLVLPVAGAAAAFLVLLLVIGAVYYFWKGAGVQRGSERVRRGTVQGSEG